MAKSSRVILSRGIKLDKEYQNCLTYNETQMLNLCLANKVVEGDNYSFIREEKNVLKVPYSYGTCLSCNYMAFQNSDYNNKWFFAFIDSVEFVSPDATKIHFTIDEFSTWFDYWHVADCFVVREHTNNDAVGANTIPEGLDTGDFIANGITAINVDANETYICAAVTEFPSNFNIKRGGTIYNGVFSGLYYVVFRTYQNARDFIRAMDYEGAGDAIYNLFMCPSNLVDLWVDPSTQGDTEWKTITISGITFEYGIVEPTLYAKNIYTTPAITSPVTLNGYTPKNNKLYIGDYNYLLVSNNVGQDYTYKYEDFINNTARFKVMGSLSMGASIKAIPMNYKLLEDPAGEESLNSYPYGITAAKYPNCPWTTDPYVNWLTQNGINILGMEISRDTAQWWTGGLGMLAGAAIAGLSTGGIGSLVGLGLIGSSASNTFNSMQENYRRDKTPSQAKGSSATGDVTFSAGMMYIPCYSMSVKAEYARSIDDYFTRYGYKTNRVKIPNQTGRTYWNYVEIGKSEIIGYATLSNKSVPAESMNIINGIYRKGVTLWHDHSNIGNYDLNNSIVQN